MIYEMLYSRSERTHVMFVIAPTPHMDVVKKAIVEVAACHSLVQAHHFHVVEKSKEYVLRFKITEGETSTLFAVHQVVIKAWNQQNSDLPVLDLHPRSTIPRMLEFGTFKIKLSYELQRSLKGERDEYHSVGLKLLQNCLLLKLKQLQSLHNQPFLNLYFKVEGCARGSILLIRVGVDKGYGLPCVLTAYFPNFSYIKKQLNLNDVTLLLWESKLSNVQL